MVDLAVNVSGSLAVGLLAAVLTHRASTGAIIAPCCRALLAAGILGGYTTFSAFSLDFAARIERKETAVAVLYAGGAVGLSLAAVFAGLRLGRIWWAA